MMRRSYFFALAITTCVFTVSLWPGPPSYGQSLLTNFISPHRDFQEKNIGQLIAYPEGKIPDKTKTSLILVHGIGAEFDKECHWARFLEYADHDPVFRKHFQVYLFRYNSSASVPALSQSLRLALRELITQQGRNARIRFLSYSEGGLLSVNAMSDPVVYAHTDRVITVGTPFHGSPLANPAWVRRELDQRFLFSPLRLTHRAIYWGLRRLFPSFQKDFRWDNFDYALTPPDGYAPETRITSPPFQSGKLITYGSYFGFHLDPHQQLYTLLGVRKPSLREFPRLRNPFSPHFFFSLARNNISDIPLSYCVDPSMPASDRHTRYQPLSKEAFPEMMSPAIKSINHDPAKFSSLVHGQISTTRSVSRQALSLMAYNDGISPITSTLWLGHNPNTVYKGNPSNLLLQELRGLRAASSARLFQGLDHLDWLDGSSRTHADRLMDLLHPGEASRPVFQWFISDLLKDVRIDEPENAPEMTTAELSEAKAAR